MSMLSPAAAAAKWSRNTQAATKSMQDGVNAVTQSPTEKAAQAVDRQVQGVIRAQQEGRTQAALRAVSLDSWKQSMINKGIPRVAQGVQASVSKMEKFNAAFYPHLQTGLQMLESMPRGGLSENINRAVAMMNHNASFRKGTSY